MKEYISDKQKCARRTTQRNCIKSRIQNDFSTFTTSKRTICPWNEDDTEMLKRLRKRVKSAPIILNSPAFQHKPGLSLSRSNTFLTILDEFDLEMSPMTSGKGQKCKRKSMPDRYIKAYMHHKESARYSDDDHLQNLILGQIRSHDQIRPHDQADQRSSSIRRPLSSTFRCSPRHVRPLEIMTSSTTQDHYVGNHDIIEEVSSISVPKLVNPNHRYSGMKHYMYSPAGYLKTNVETTEKVHCRHCSNVDRKSRLPFLPGNDEIYT